MIGERIESRSGIPILSIVALVLAFVMATVMILNERTTGLPATLAILGLAIGAWFGRERKVAFRLEEDGIEFEQPHFTLPNDKIEMVVPEDNPETDHFGIQIQHPHGVIRLPAQLNVSSRELLQELRSRVAPLDPTQLPGAIRTFHDDENAKFGADRVFAFFGRRYPPLAKHRIFSGGMIGLIVGAIVMGIVGNATARHRDDQFGWLTATLVIALYATLALLFAYLITRQRREWSHPHAALVISPTGIAMSQGDLKGKMRWEEVKAIEQPPKNRIGFQPNARSRRGIGIVVTGAYIVITDSYHHRASDIVKVMRAYWRDGSD